jgi:hypothetical protein
MNKILQWLTLLMLLCCLQPAFATPTTPTTDFIDNGDGTVTHKLTGLVWMRCSMGQTWDKATASCTGTAATYTWDAAMALKSNFAGKSDWRLPNMPELNTILNFGSRSSYINNSIFPNIPSDWFWSSTPSVERSSYGVLALGFKYGDGWDAGIDGVGLVRLVRSGQPFDSLPLTTPSKDFVDNGDGTVTHKRTGLTWMHCAMGQTWNQANSSCSGIALSYTYDEGMALTSTFANRTNWRLPSISELMTISEYGTGGVNNTIFPDTPYPYWFWSSSFYDNNYAWAKYLGYGNPGHGGGSRSDKYFIMLVSGKWTTPPAIITDVSPKTSVLGSPRVFTVTGTNLTAGMGFTVGDCQYSNSALTGGTATKRQFLCTQYGLAGDKTGLVKTAPGGTTLYKFTVKAQPDNIPEVYAATDKKELTSTNDIVSVLISTTVQNRLNTAALYDLYLRFTLPDGTILYDDGTQMVSKKTPFSSKSTITQASDWTELLPYSLSDTAPSGTYIADIQLYSKNLKTVVSSSATVFDYLPPVAAPAMKSAMTATSKAHWLIRHGIGSFPTRQTRALSAAATTTDDPSTLITKYKEACKKAQETSTLCISLEKQVMALQLGSKYFAKVSGVDGIIGSFGIFKKSEYIAKNIDTVDKLLSSYRTYQSNTTLTSDQKFLLMAMKVTDAFFAKQLTLSVSDMADSLAKVLEKLNNAKSTIAKFDDVPVADGIWFNVSDHCWFSCRHIKSFELTPLFTLKRKPDNDGNSFIPLSQYDRVAIDENSVKTTYVGKAANFNTIGTSSGINDYSLGKDVAISLGLYMAKVQYLNGAVYRQPVFIDKSDETYVINTDE